MAPILAFAVLVTLLAFLFISNTVLALMQRRTSNRAVGPDLHKKTIPCDAKSNV